jgi:quinoprotein glucose dehydrogenase
MAGERMKKILKGLVVFIVLTPLLLWGGVTVGAKLTVAKDATWGQISGMVAQGLFGSVICAVKGCEAELLEGMESVVFDAELLTSTPVAIEIDEAGRVLVAETGRQDQGAEDNRNHDYWLMDDLASRTVGDRRAYYQKWIDKGEIEDPDRFTSATDRVVVLEDTDGDGVADSRIELASWNEMASGLVAGLEAREGAIYVTSVPSVYRILDADADGVAESIDTLHTGFGVKTSLIGHDLHGLVWGPDGKLYFSMGDRGYHVTLPSGEVLEPTLGPGRGAVFRMNPDGSALEVFATGVRNPQELAFDDYGNLFTGDNNGDGGDSARIVYLVEGGETGWAMPYQTLVGDYIRGPWVAEELWELQHETQPAWVLPPVAHIANGPAGFMHYPGLGLPERYANHFFLCDYAYVPGRSGIWSFELEPKGAAFEMVDRHHFAWSVLATDFDFSWDGRMFATVFDQLSLKQQIVQWQHPPSRDDARVEDLARLAQENMADRSPEELLALLQFPDQRLRLRAQFELAERRETSALVAQARDSLSPLIPRLHALWGLGQIGSDGLRAIAPADLAWAADEPVAFRTQLLKVAGDSGAEWLVSSLRLALRDPSARVRFFAAQALGALKDSRSQEALVEVVRENADEDVFLRHAVVWALHRIGDLDRVSVLREDESRSVRVAALLTLRQSGDPRVAGFLADADPLIVVEAARAIYDWPIDEAMSELAFLVGGLEAAIADDLQTSQALHRRVIGANVRLRSEVGAAALARYAADEDHLEGLRIMALEALGHYSKPPLRDLTMGFYRPLPDADPEIVASVFRGGGRDLLDSSLGSRAMEIANRLGELPLNDDELFEIIDAEPRAVSERVSAMGALVSRAKSGVRGPVFDASVERGLASGDASVRIAARDLQLELDPGRGLSSLLVSVESGQTLEERKHAWVRLGDFDHPSARDMLTQGLVDWQSNELEDAVALEVIESAKAQSGGLAVLAERAMVIDPPADAAGLVSARRWALAGGDSEAGQRIFQTTGDCQRCHGGAGGHGGGAGPSLAGVSAQGAEHVLESILAPAEKIAAGFGSIVVTRKDGSTVAGLLVSADSPDLTIDVGGDVLVVVARDEVLSRTEEVTGMPPIGLGLVPHDLRNLMAYVLSL